MPKIQEMLINIEGYKYATSLDLNMRYYHIRLRMDASNICTIILTWDKYKYKRLPMGVCNAPGFPGKMNKLFKGFECICLYINDLIVLATSNWIDHLNKLEKVLIKSQ